MFFRRLSLVGNWELMTAACRARTRKLKSLARSSTDAAWVALLNGLGEIGLCLKGGGVEGRCRVEGRRWAE